MDIHRKLLTALMVATVSGCATPDMDTDSPNFSPITYLMDVGQCGGSATVTTTIYGISGAIAGSAFGAMHGATSGSIAGDAKLGVIAGAMSGGAIGFGLEASKAFDEGQMRNKKCLADKGYW